MLSLGEKTKKTDSQSLAYARPLGVACLLTEEFQEKFIRIQAEILRSMQLTPVLGTSTNIPHVTIIQGNFDERFNPEEFACRDDLATASSSNPTMMLEGFQYQHRGWLFLKVKADGWLRSLQNEVLSYCKPYLVPPTEVDEKRTRDYSPAERESYLRYGYRYIGDAFKPHVTLGRLSTEMPANTLERLNDLFLQEEINCCQRVQSISVYEMGESGAHAKILALRKCCA